MGCGVLGRQFRPRTLPSFSGAGSRVWTLDIFIIIVGARCGALRHKPGGGGAGSIPDGVTGIFHRHNPSGRTIALGSTQPLTNEYQEYFLGVQAVGA